jgi:hypothetical protein
MELYQSRGYVRSISSDGKALFVVIGTRTQFDCKKNKLKKTPPTGSFDSTIYNIFMEVELSSQKSPGPVYLKKDSSRVFALPEDSQIPVEKDVFSKFESFFESAFETESTFIIEVTNYDDYKLTLKYIQLGPENNDE